MAAGFLCVGHACYDISVNVPGYPQENSKSEIHELVESGGGPAANAAYLLGSWGARCAFAGLVGDDHYGRRVASEFASVGVDCSLLELRPNHPTPLSIIVVNSFNGSRTIINRKLPEAFVHLDPVVLRARKPDVLLFDGHEPEAAIAAMKAFPTAISILDAGSAREGTLRLAGEVGYLAASERFALQATGMANLDSEKSRRDCIALLRERHGNTAIVTLGERGVIADSGDGYFHLPAFPANVIDTTAAGDIFHGAFAYGIGQRMELNESLRMGVMAASLSVRVCGGRKSIPSLQDVQEALNNTR